MVLANGVLRCDEREVRADHSDSEEKRLGLVGSRLQQLNDFVCVQVIRDDEQDVRAAYSDAIRNECRTDNQQVRESG